MGFLIHLKKVLILKHNDILTTENSCYRSNQLVYLPPQSLTSLPIIVANLCHAERPKPEISFDNSYDAKCCNAT